MDSVLPRKIPVESRGRVDVPLRRRGLYERRLEGIGGGGGGVVPVLSWSSEPARAMNVLAHGAV